MTAAASSTPVLTVLTVSGDAAALQASYQSLLAQTDRRWEWCVAGRPEDRRDARRSAGLPLDPRVTVLASGEEAFPGRPADRLVDAFARATGDHVLLLEAGDRLDEQAVAAVASALRPGAWGYSDEAQDLPDAAAPDIWEKPDHSPELLRSQPYPVRSAFLPRAVLAERGGIDPAAATAAWYDAVLRVSEAAGPAVHVRRPLVLRMDPDLRRQLVPGDPQDHIRVVREHCRRVGIELDDVAPLTVQDRPVGQRLRRRLNERPTVSIVIPTRGTTSVVRGRPRCHIVELLRSIWVPGRYPALEVVVVYDAETPGPVLDEVRAIVGPDVVLCRYDDWFHFSRKCNQGAVVARGEYLCFLNDDMEVISPDWLTEMVSLLQDPTVAAVGARLLFADGTIQHAGHHYVGGRAGHPFFGWPGDTLAQGAIAQLTGERSGVTAACMLVRARDFRYVGGFSEQFPLNYNDVDMCLKLRERGSRVLYTPHAEFFHFESQTRQARILRSEQELLSRRWSLRTLREPFVPLPGPTWTTRELRRAAAAASAVDAPSRLESELVKENHD